MALDDLSCDCCGRAPVMMQAADCTAARGAIATAGSSWWLIQSLFQRCSVTSRGRGAYRCSGAVHLQPHPRGQDLFKLSCNKGLTHWGLFLPNEGTKSLSNINGAATGGAEPPFSQPHSKRTGRRTK